MSVPLEATPRAQLPDCCYKKGLHLHFIVSSVPSSTIAVVFLHSGLKQGWIFPQSFSLSSSSSSSWVPMVCASSLKDFRTSDLIWNNSAHLAEHILASQSRSSIAHTHAVDDDWGFFFVCAQRCSRARCAWPWRGSASRRATGTRVPARTMPTARASARPKASAAASV